MKIRTLPESHPPGATPLDFRLRQPVAIGPFDIHARIGLGGMGEVWRGKHRAQGLPVAVKVLNGFASRDAPSVTAFSNEVRAVAGFDHPNIITVFDYGKISAEAEAKSYGKVQAGNPYLVMELASGGWLDSTIVQLRWAEIQRLLTSLLDALAHAHARGVVHRDLKPENVLLPSRGADWSLLKVTDFGIAHAIEWLDPEAATDPMSGAGTPHYMAPEQIYCRWRDQGPWTDLYAIGCLAWEMVCGLPPFDFNDLDQVVDAQLTQPPPPLKARIEVPEGLEAWLNRLLAKNPLDRYRRAADALWAMVRLAPPSVAPRTLNLGVASPGADATPESPTLRSLGPRAATITDLSLRDNDVSSTAAGAPASPPRHWAANLPPFPPKWRTQESELKTMQVIGAGIGLYGVRTIPLVDREPERNLLWRTLRSVRSGGSARLVALSGPSGVGKSHLAEWLCHRAHEVGSAIVMRATFTDVPTATSGLGHMLAQHFGCLALPRAAIRQRLERLLTRQGVDDPYEWHALTELIVEHRSCDPDPEGHPITFSNNSQRYAIIRRLLTRLSSERPVVLWLDDAHSRRTALAFARYLLRFRTGLPVLLLLTVQDEALAERAEEQELLQVVLDLSGTIDMRIQALDPQATLQLVRRLLMFQGELTNRIAQRVAGNPAFAVALVGDWVRRGVLGLGRTGFVVRPGAEDDLPDDLYQVWSGRLTRFINGIGDDVDARHALELAASLGRRFDRQEWQLACIQWGVQGGDPDRVDALTTSLAEDLLGENLVRQTDAPHQLVFVHSMVRESLERASREAGRWVDISLTCAATLDTTYPAEQESERRGRYLIAGCAYAQAIAPLLRAAKLRWRRGSLAVALDLLAQREDALLRAGVGEEDPRWGEGWVLRARVHAERGEFEQASGWSSAADAQAARRPGVEWREVRGDSLLAAGTLALQRGDLTSAKAELALAWDVYAGLQAPLDQARCAMALGQAEVASGEFSRGAELVTAALDLFTTHGSDHDAARALRALGELAWLLGKVEDSRELYERAKATATRAGDRLVAGQCILGLAEVARSRGELQTSEEGFSEAMELLRELEADWHPARTKLALVKLQRGKFVPARKLLDDGLAAARKLGRTLATGRLAAMAMAPAAHDLDWARYDELAGLAAEHLHGAELMDPDVAWTTSLAGELTVAAGQSERARIAYELALDQWAALGKLDRAQHVQRALDRL